LGAIIHLEEVLLESSEPTTWFSIGMFLWSLIPYCVILILRSSLYGAFCAAVGVFVLDLWIHVDIFVFPTSSTAAIGLLFMPLWNLIIVIPFTYFVGSIIEKHVQSVQVRKIRQR
jgi:hypothetical protein